MNSSTTSLNKLNMEAFNFAYNSVYHNFGPYPAVNGTTLLSDELKSDIDSVNSQLIIACSQGRFNLVAALIENGHDIDQRDSRNFTPMMYAASNGHLNVVTLLLTYGAKISYQLLCIVKEKIDRLEEEAITGKEDPYQVASWKNFLDFLVQEGKKQQ